jgi:Xaa-Pro aminopeptidase
MLSEGVEALVVAASANVTYVTGFDDVFDDEPSSVCVITPGSAKVFVDSRYVEAARAAAGTGPWEVMGPESDVWESALAVLDADLDVVFGIEASVSHSRFARVAKGREARVRAADGWVERARVVKEGEEIDRIARAATIADTAFEHVLGSISPGVTELEIALELEMFMRRRGSEGVAFPSIVASGPNSSRPHAHAGTRVLERGDLITMDFGARVGGYCSDMTRTVALGSVAPGLRTIYDVVLAANEAGLSAARAGRTGAEIDAEARRVIAEAGFADKFGHGLGHGVGLEVHEGPSVGQRGTTPVPAGSVVTIEPGVYVPGLGGVRIEDLVVVEENGARLLSHSPKHLIEL